MAAYSVNLSEFLEYALVGVRRASSFMALGLRTASDQTISSVKIDTNFQILFMPDPLSPAQSQDVRGNFGKWVIANGLRELDQHLAAYLDAVYPALIAMKAGGKVASDLKQLSKVMLDDTNLGNKLKRLEDEFGIASSSRLHIASMSRARNAITHNLGRVAARHCNDGDALKLTWRGLGLQIGGIALNEGFAPFVVQGPAAVIFGPVERVKIFNIGAQVELSAHDLSEICLMFKTQAEELHKRILQYAKSCKIEVEDQSGASDPGLASEVATQN